MDLQQSQNGVLDGEHVIHKRLACDEDSPQRLPRFALHVHRTIVSEPHHVGDTPRIAAVGLIRSRREKPLSVTGLDAHRLETAFDECAVQPFR